MDNARDIRLDQICQRLRRPPGERVTTVVPKEALPIPFFGDLFTARAASIALNPGFTGPNNLAESLASLQVPSRESLSQDQCDKAILRLRTYFLQQPARDAWFSHLQRVLEGIGFSGYWDAVHGREGDTVHLDLVQEPTIRKWSKLTKDEKEALFAADLPFLKWQIETFPLIVLLCDGSTAFDRVRQLVGASETAAGSIRSPNLYFNWHVALASVNGRKMGVVGWDFPLSRPTGLDANGERSLGKLMAEKLLASGLPPWS